MSDTESYLHPEPGEPQPKRPRMLEEDRPRPTRRTSKRKRRGGDRFMGTLLTLFAGGTGLVVIWTLLIIMNPQSALNPFAKAMTVPTPTLFVMPTLPPTQPVLPPTWTPSPTVTIAPTGTYQATNTPSPTAEATATAEVAETQAPLPTLAVFPFTVDGEIEYERNRNGDDCAWMSIAGEVFDTDGNPVIGVGINVRGESFEWFAWSGSETRFGPSGYEVYLNSSPYVANWTVQLIHSNVRPLSEPVTLRTSADCSKNVVILNFVQNHEYTP